MKSGHPNQVSKISQIRCQRQTQGSQCLPLNQCSQQDFSNSTPPYSCGFLNGEHQFCCVGQWFLTLTCLSHKLPKISKFFQKKGN